MIKQTGGCAGRIFATVLGCGDGVYPIFANVAGKEQRSIVNKDHMPANKNHLVPRGSVAEILRRENVPVEVGGKNPFDVFAVTISVDGKSNGMWYPASAFRDKDVTV